MSSLPAPISLKAETQMYPTLTPEQIERVRPIGTEHKVEVGEVLYRPGDVGRGIYILLGAEVEITQLESDGERHVTRLTSAMFTGEAGLIASQRAVVLARVVKAGDLLEVNLKQLRALVTRDAQLSEILLRAFILRRLMLITRQLGNVVIIGSLDSKETVRIREFLERNGHPYNYVELDTDSASQILFDRFGVTREEIPVVICNGKTVLRKPSPLEVADCLGLNDNVDLSALRDLIVIGAGPAGLAAAVYAASEGLDTLVMESLAPGGQAGASSKIENYPGFPTGISGQELATNIATQAQKFGAHLFIACSAIKLRCDRRPYELEADHGRVFRAKTIIVATGARYNRPTTQGLEQFEGQGIHYAATHLEAQSCTGEEVVVVGGGNSPGQAAMFLSETAKRVYMLIRSKGLSETMSRYLIERICRNPRVELVSGVDLTSVHGTDSLHAALWTSRETGAITSRSVRHVFVMTGATPNTEWLRGSVALDGKGFILTGRDLPLAVTKDQSSPWPLPRPPHMLESSLPGVFVVGDVRAGSVKRVASAVGEGAISVSLVHRILAEP